MQAPKSQKFGHRVLTAVLAWPTYPETESGPCVKLAATATAAAAQSINQSSDNSDRHCVKKNHHRRRPFRLDRRRLTFAFACLLDHPLCSSTFSSPSPIVVAPAAPSGQPPTSTTHPRFGTTPGKQTYRRSTTLPVHWPIGTSLSTWTAS